MQLKEQERSPSLVRKRETYLPRKTSVSLEDAFWNALKEIAAAKNPNLSRHDLVRQIARKCPHANLSSAIRLFVLEYYRGVIDSQATARPDDAC